MGQLDFRLLKTPLAWVICRNLGADQISDDSVKLMAVAILIAATAVNRQIAQAIAIERGEYPAIAQS